MSAGSRPVSTVFLNGRFLSQAMTGVQRFASEIVAAIDRKLADGDVPAELAKANFTLLVPAHAKKTIDLAHITVQSCGRRSGHAWDQIDLAWGARSGILLSLANSGPVVHRRHLVVLHDAQVYRRPDFFRSSYRMLHQTLGRAYARTATIGTVSEFSRRELADVLKLSPRAIGVYPNGCEHLGIVAPDDRILPRLGLRTGSYFLAVGTMTTNKNLAVAAAATGRIGRPDVPLVIAGGGNDRVFDGEIDEAMRQAVMAGRVTDAELAALYRHAAAFIFPSLYEGFGIPPLEAMVHGCPVIASTADAVVETCADGAVYFDPYDVDALVRLMRERLEGRPPLEVIRPRQAARVRHYSWARSADALLAAVAAIARPQSE